MRLAARMLSATLCCSAAGALAQQQAIAYPPLDAPLYLQCKMRAVGESTPPAQWPGLVLYFPDGIAAAFPEMRIVDRHNQLEGGRFGFSIRGERHWSLIDSPGVPDADEASSIPQIMFLPPSGRGENLQMLFLKEAEPVSAGVCVGMIGPATRAAYEASAADSPGLD